MMFRLFNRKKTSGESPTASGRSLTELRIAKLNLLLKQRTIQGQIRQKRVAHGEYTQKRNTQIFKGKTTKLLRGLITELADLERELNRVVSEILSLDKAILRVGVQARALEDVHSKNITSDAMIPPSAASRFIHLNVRQAVWERDQGHCVGCGAWGPGASIEFDHVIPFSKGGANTEKNLQLLCKRCNQQKSDRI